MNTLYILNESIGQGIWDTLYFMNILCVVIAFSYDAGEAGYLQNVPK